MDNKLIEIKSWLDGKVLFSAECENIKDCLNLAVNADVNLNFANLNRASLDGARLNGASLNRAILDGASLNRASLNRASLYDAKLPSIAKIDNLFTQIHDRIKDGCDLEMDSWHTCETVHCIAGWAVVLAGDAGRVAESMIYTSAAGALIINESCPYLNGKVPDFTSSNEEGMRFIEECAAKEREILAAST